MKVFYILFTTAFYFGLSSCGNGSETSGEIKIDGSSTVYPITEAVAEEFLREFGSGVQITVSVSGTGGGFQKFCRGEIDIANASRSIQPEEINQCKNADIGYIELPVAYDGMAVLINPENDWVDYLTVEELKKIWEPAAQDNVKLWSRIRPEWPEEELHLYGPGVASGTYDYFTEAIVGEGGRSRGDFTASEDDNVLVQGISTDKYALGFFGMAYYEENKDKLKLVPIDNGSGPVLPTIQTIKDGTYAPLSRHIFIYVSSRSAKQPHVRKFVEFYLNNAAQLSKEVGYIPLPAEEYEKQIEKFNAFASSAGEAKPGL